MSVFEIVSSGDRRSLVERFSRKSKQQAISELVDIHLTHCTRIERLEAENETLKAAAMSIRDVWREDSAMKDVLSKSLKALVTGECGQQLLQNFDSGQGSATDDGKAWLAARALMAEAVPT
ncbi:hypothetical protein [Pseudomonas ovata]|uniref:hypothetical protein n=1 Tax=Pseudomonas ovata TaxID=1839709 RepID=UPI00126012CD|nr:hypothetical protein [Pseudomonas ovata]